jgi:hypothetical protein
MEDFEAIDGGTDSAVDPFAETEAPPPQESPTPQWEVPYEPPVQPNYNRQDYDDVPAWIDDVEDLESYTKHVLAEAGSRFRRSLAEEKLRARVETAEARAMEVHNGKDGLDDYSTLVQFYAVPILQQRPDLKNLVMRQHDVPAAAYLIGFCAKYPHLAQEVVRRRGKIDSSIFQSINFRPTVQGRNSGRRQPSGKVNYADWDNESFEAELERFKMSSEGE